MSEPHPDVLAGRLVQSADGLSAGALQRLLDALVREYARRTEGAAEPMPPLPQGGAATATDVVVTVTELLRAADVAVFELGMWRALGRR